MNTTEAAAYLGITVEQLIRSRKRGLPPGILGKRVEGELFWHPDDLIPPPSQIATTPTEWGPGDEQTEIPTNEAVNPSGASDSTSSKDVYFRLDDSDSLDRSGKLSDPLYCSDCDREFSTVSGKASHDRAKHGG